jgi:hypothetical protein
VRILPPVALCRSPRPRRYPVLYPAERPRHERLRRLGIRHVGDDYGAGTTSAYSRRDLRETLPDLMRVLASR